MTCISRAISSLEKRTNYRCDDNIAVLLLPRPLQVLIRIPFFRTLFIRLFAPKGMYEYVIARTKFIDAIFAQALANQFLQIVLLGAGFDTRGLRFQGETASTRIFELDAPITQSAKMGQYLKRGLNLPGNVQFMPIDLDQESLPAKLAEIGFRRAERTLFILEGLLMYLQPESVDRIFQIVRESTEKGSEIVFDYVYSSVLRHENLYVGEREILRTVSKAGEQWHFGIEKGEINQFLERYGMRLVEHMDAERLEGMYFKDTVGRIVGRINGTHAIARATRV